MTASGPDPSSERETDRRQVVAELQKHYVEGRLTAEELGERVAQASAARTFGELAGTLSDLPMTSDKALRTQGGGWNGTVFGLPIEAVLAGVAVLLLLTFLFLPGFRFGLFPVWPLFIWGFFFFGRPRRGGRFH